MGGFTPVTTHPGFKPELTNLVPGKYGTSYGTLGGILGGLTGGNIIGNRFMGQVGMFGSSGLTGGSG
jgi:hypothetical protein